MKQMIGGSAVLVLGSALATGANAMAGPEKWVTSSALNLRSQPSMSASILLVIPEGALVGYLEDEQDGFTNVSYDGSIGWAKSEYLSPANGGGDSNSGNGTDAAYRGQAVTSSSVNMRNGGGMDYGVILVLPAGAVVNVYDNYANYFWQVDYNGQFGWVHDDYLIMDYDGAPTDDGGDSDMWVYSQMGTTNATVNLRAGQGTDFQVLDVVPEGASIELYAGPAGSWGRVSYNGQFGYIFSDYIASTY